MFKTAGGTFRTVLGLAALLSIAACDLAGPVVPSPTPPSRPSGLVTPPAPTPAPAPAQVSDASRILSVHFQRLQNDLLARGLLRTDGGGPDTVFTDTMLARKEKRR